MARVLFVTLAALAVFACDRGDTRPAPATKRDGARAPLAVGSSVPDLTLSAHTGETLALAKLGKPAVVYFYPKDDTPGCTVEAQEIRDLYQEIRSTGAVVIGVSADGKASHQAFAEKYALPFLLVPDEDHAVATAFGVPIANGKASRVSFVIDAKGRVTRVFPKVTPKGHGAELLAALSEPRSAP
jgi:peroxiredoxin Q/BCP